MVSRTSCTCCFAYSCQYAQDTQPSPKPRVPMIAIKIENRADVSNHLFPSMNGANSSLPFVRCRFYTNTTPLPFSTAGHEYRGSGETALYWPAVHYPMDDKSEIYSVEGDNADLQHYLARLGRRSRCFSRCQRALTSESPRYIPSHHGEHATQFIGTRQQ